MQENNHNCDEVYVVNRMDFVTTLDLWRVIETPGIVQPTHRHVGISKPSPHSRLKCNGLNILFKLMETGRKNLMRKTATVYAYLNQAYVCEGWTRVSSVLLLSPRVISPVMVSSEVLSLTQGLVPL